MFHLFSRRPATLGPSSGRLRPCSNSPNCVSSQADNLRQTVAPLEFSDDPVAAFNRLEQIVAATPRTRIVTRTADYLHAECQTRLLRFVDDLEFLLDAEARVIHVRSASRVGRSDLGVNRRRVEAIRRQFAAE